MSYPDYPNNRMIVGGVDLTVAFGMILLDGYKLSTPEPKVYTVDIPGGDGAIDLTESLTGNVAYNNRTDEFTFVILDVDNFEQIKTRLSNFLHGKAFDYKLTMDPDYTYHGRFQVSEYAHSVVSNGIVGSIAVKVVANPYKSKGLQTYKLNATGGKMFRLESGRKPVRPTIECSQPCVVTWKDKVINVGAGSFVLNDVLFTQGWNDIYINSFRFWNVKWLDLGEGGTHQMTWEQASKYRWDDLQRLSGDVHDVPRSWAEIADKRWSDLAEMTWDQLDFRSEVVPDTTVYLQYEWKDL